VAPALLGFELADVCLIKTRRHPAQGPALAAAYTLRHQLGVEERAIDHDGALDLTARAGLTAYDASYLWLARQLRAELVTLDGQLERAAPNPDPRRRVALPR
jgi:predicted nucleic acid-binding protein